MTMRGIYPAYDVNESAPSIDLGAKRDYDHSTYGKWELKYVQYSSSATGAAAAGTVLFYEDIDANIVTDDYSASAGGGSNQNVVAGVAIGALTAGYYGWMLVRGKLDDVKKKAGVDSWAAGDALIGGDADGVTTKVAKGTAPTHKVLGWALAASDDPNDTIDAYICVE